MILRDTRATIHISSAVLAPFGDSQTFEHRSVDTSGSDNLKRMLGHLGNAVIV